MSAKVKALLGPWTVGEDCGKAVRNQVDFECRNICVCETSYGDGETLAKAIAGLPNLLKAAKHLLENALDRDECHDDETGEWFEDWKALSDAIDKVEGASDVGTGR